MVYSPRVHSDYLQDFRALCSFHPFIWQFYKLDGSSNMWLFQILQCQFFLSHCTLWGTHFFLSKGKWFFTRRANFQMIPTWEMQLLQVVNVCCSQHKYNSYNRLYFLGDIKHAAINYNPILLISTSSAHPGTMLNHANFMSILF